MLVRRARHRDEQVVELQGDESDHPFGESIPEQRHSDALAPFGGQERADRHSAEKNDENDDLRVRAVTDEQADVTSPHRLVDQAGGAGKDEKERE